MSARTINSQGVRIAVEGCGHGTLDAIYASVAKSSKVRGWDGVDLLIIGGDFQAVRNAQDLTIMSCPPKYRHLGDFHKYYSGEKKAPYLTIFIGGNHEAASHLWELYYGGWVAPNIHYLGAANVLRLGPIRIAGMSGIWAGHDYNKPHHERLPFNSRDVKSFYHVREMDVRKLLLLRTQVDVGLSHDWPRGIEKLGDSNWLFNNKKYFRRESIDGTLGNPAAKYVMDRLRPPYWFSAHLHVKYAAVKKYRDEETSCAAAAVSEQDSLVSKSDDTAPPQGNPDEIDLDLDLDDVPDEVPEVAVQSSNEQPNESVEDTNTVSEELRAQLPASFARPEPRPQQPKTTPGQPVPETITNKEVRFLSLDKCLPGRHFLQLTEVKPINSSSSSPQHRPYRLQYDPEWLSITRLFHKTLQIGPTATNPPNLGEQAYIPLIDAERRWVDENITDLNVPQDFTITAPPHVPGSPEIVREQPLEWTNPQTAAFCAMLGVENLWDATDEEREGRRVGAEGMLDEGFNRGGGGVGYRGRGGGGGGGRGRGGGWGGGRGRGQGRGRGRS